MITSLEDKIKVTQIVICVSQNDKTIDKFHDCKKVARSLPTIICDNLWHFTTFSKEYPLLWKQLHKHDIF
jgi:hypothetical protein